MEEMFRWLSIGFIAGLWLSLEEAQCKSGTSQKPHKVEHNFRCFSIHPVPVEQRQDKDCVDFEIENLVSYCEKSQEDDICKSSITIPIKGVPLPDTAEVPGSGNHSVLGEDSTQTGVEFPYPACSADNNQCLCIIPESKLISILGTDKLRRFNRRHMCCIVCRKDNLTRTTIAMTNRPTTTHSSSTRDTPAVGKTGSTSSTGQGQSNGGFSGQRDSDNSNTILIVLILFVAVVFIIVAVVLFVRKRKLTRTNENEAISSGYEPTVRENHYEPSAEGVPIYTELELTQEPAPSNSTVYSSVQPTGEAVDMGKRVVYAELDNVAVAVSPVYSQPLDTETAANNAEYAEPFKPDNKSTATAPVANLYDNIAAVDQQNVYSLATAIPSSDPNVIYSQPNKPGK